MSARKPGTMAFVTALAGVAVVVLASIYVERVSRVGPVASPVAPAVTDVLMDRIDRFAQACGGLPFTVEIRPDGGSTWACGMVVPRSQVPRPGRAKPTAPEAPTALAER